MEDNLFRPASASTGTLEVSHCPTSNSLKRKQSEHRLNRPRVHLVPGDSGAWVFEKSTGRICGHVLAWSEKSHTAYIAPMEVILEDIARTLNATFITLPGSPDESVASAMSQSAFPESPDAGHRARLRIPEQLPVDIGRLNIGINDSDFGPVPTSRASRGLRASPSPSPSAAYRGMPPILTPPRGLERQLA